MIRILTAALLMTATGVAQDIPAPQSANLSQTTAPGVPRLDQSPVTVQEQLKPAFIIKPLVHRLSARRGQLLQFQFEIEANARPTRLEISPVAMTQQEHGVIMPDPEAIPPGVVQLMNDSEVTLQVGQSHTIRCQLRIPPVNAPFLSYGILVKELPLEEGAKSQNPDKPRVGIRFLTQYLLRTDIRVTGVQGDSVRELQIVDGHMSARSGNAVVMAFVDNPTDTSMEFQVRTHLVSVENRRRYTSRLWMPVRSSQPEPDRYDVRILGQTKLRLEGELPEPVFPGSYELQVELLYQGRIYQKAAFPVEIRSGDFPAQDATIVRVTRDISIEPPHVELSLRKGGNRLQSITVENGSQQTVVAQLKAIPFRGQLAETLSFRPDVIELPPGRSRKVLVTLGARRDFEDHAYAFAEVTVRPEIGEAIGSQRIPIALLTNSESHPEVVDTKLNWKADAAATGFEIPLRNSGDRHLLLFGTLTLRDEFGRGFTLEDGFGRWVLPGQEDKLWFPFPQVPPPGTYSLKAEIQQGEGMEPAEVTQTIRLLSPLEERVSQNPDATNN